MSSRLIIFPLFVMTACIGVYVWAQDNPPANAPQPPSLENLPRLLPPPVPSPPPQLTPPRTPPPSTPPETAATPKLPLIAGMPYKEALAILKRHEGELMNLSGVDAVDMDEEGILVYTDNPSVVPPTIEGLPVRTTIPLAQTFPPVKPEDPKVPPPPLDCGPYAHWEPEVGRCRRDALPPDSLIPSSPRIPLPPPAGVVVLRPDGVREKANVCPDGFEEKTEREWRFCLPPGYADPLPPLWEPPIEGVPYEEALAILERHKPQLLQLPGATGVGLSAYGIVVFTDNPAVVPSAVEGLPIVTRPSIPLTVSSHSRTAPIRPLRGAVAVRDQLWIGTGTLTSTVLSQGKPWLIFPTHLMRNCDTASVCIPGTTPTLNDCSHYAGIRRIVQPPQGVSPIVGFVQRWDRIAVGGALPNIDAAAAFMDDNGVEGDGSLLAEKAIEGWGSFSGQQATATVGRPVTLISSLNTTPGSHTLSLNVVAVNVNHDATFRPGDCHDPDNMSTTNVVARYINQTVVEPPPQGLCPTFGDSGSPILDEFGRIVSMLNLVSSGSSCEGVGTGADTIKDFLGFDTWYGTNTTDLSVQMYPTFRTVLQGQGACAWTYIKNTGTVTAQNVAIQNTTAYVPQPTFDYLNPAGVWNTPYNIPAGQTAQFAVCMTLTQPQIPINWIPNFYGTTAASPIIKAAYNTFATRWTTIALPDPATSTATLSNDDVVHTGGPTGTGAFSLTVLNVGASGPVTITLDTDWGYGGLPYTLWVCEINAQAQCITPLSPSLSIPMPANEPRYFTVLAQGQGQAVTLDPYYHRVFFRIREGLNNPTGTLVGGAGLSITTN